MIELLIECVFKHFACKRLATVASYADKNLSFVTRQKRFKQLFLCLVEKVNYECLL